MYNLKINNNLILHMPPRQPIKYIVTIYITAHGRANIEAKHNKFSFNDRDIYIGQESGNCSVQLRDYDEKLLQIVSRWDLHSQWIASGANICYIDHPDYKPGPFQYEDDTQIINKSNIAMVGPISKIDKILDMEGRSSDLSRPGVIIMIQERNNVNHGLNESMIRNILRKTYTRNDHIGKDPFKNEHRFSAIYINNRWITPDENHICKKFNEYITNNQLFKLSEVITMSKLFIGQLIQLKPTDDTILYTIADTTCNAYYSEDIISAPPPDQNEVDIIKSSHKARQLGNLLCPVNNNKIFIPLVSVIASHGTGLFTPPGQRLRPRRGDVPMLQL